MPSKLPVVLVPGGAGFIGSHVVLALLQTRRYKVAVMDNLSNAHGQALARVYQLALGSLPSDATPADRAACKPDFIMGDLRNQDQVRRAFARYGPKGIHAVVLVAALKAPAESGRIPLQYYDVNVGGPINLLNIMTEFQCTRLIYSSSATVYGAPSSPDGIPIPEQAPLNPTNVYGRTKAITEQLIEDCCAAYPIRAICLRYFNPAGAHPSGMLGEDPRGKPVNLLPLLSQMAMGKYRAQGLQIFGDDYATPDGTCIRDFIHIMDLASGHVNALDGLENDALFASAWAENKVGGFRAYNLGTGRGYSVLQVVDTMRRLSGYAFPFKVAPRRPGDVGCVTADPTLAYRELGFRADCTLEDMCCDLLKWQRLNPHGYVDPTASTPTVAPQRKMLEARMLLDKKPLPSPSI